MSGRVRCILLLTATLIPIVATLGAPDVDGLSRSVRTLFRAPPTEVSTASLSSAAPALFSDSNPHRPRVGPGRPFHFQDAQPAAPAQVEGSQPRGLLLSSMYVSFAALQALDAHSTILALDRGARESNAIVAPFANSTPGLIALKAGTAAGVIFMTDRVRRHNRMASYIIMAAANSAYAMVVANNYRVAARLAQ